MGLFGSQINGEPRLGVGWGQRMGETLTGLLGRRTMRRPRDDRNLGENHRSLQPAALDVSGSSAAPADRVNAWRYQAEILSPAACITDVTGVPGAWVFSQSATRVQCDRKSPGSTDGTSARSSSGRRTARASGSALALRLRRDGLPTSPPRVSAEAAKLAAGQPVVLVG
jgi:hypothetical protein